MVHRAEQAVSILDAAIKRFRQDMGAYPGNLGELLTRPQRIGAVKGAWPYVAEIPAGPWGQAYRYEHPGKFNPDLFDVYSVRGNSRDPAGWIGN